MNNFTYEEVCSLHVPALRDELKTVGLPSYGLKAELIERLWSYFEEQRKLQGGPDREVPTSTPLPHALEIGETTDPSGYIWDNQCTMKDDLDRLSLDDEGSEQVNDEIFESSTEIDPQDRILVQKKIHQAKNWFNFIIGAAEYRNPSKLVGDLVCVRNDAASINTSDPQDMPILRNLQRSIEHELEKAKDKFNNREAVEKSIAAAAGRSISVNEAARYGSLNSLLTGNTMEKIQEDITKMVQKCEIESFVKPILIPVKMELQSEIANMKHFIQENCKTRELDRIQAVNLVETKIESLRQEMKCHLTEELENLRTKTPAQEDETHKRCKSEQEKLLVVINEIRATSTKMEERLKFYEQNMGSLAKISEIIQSHASGINEAKSKANQAEALTLNLNCSIVEIKQELYQMTALLNNVNSSLPSMVASVAQSDGCIQGFDNASTFVHQIPVLGNLQAPTYQTSETPCNKSTEALLPEVPLPQTQEHNVVNQPSLPVSGVLSNRHIRCIDKLTNTASEINNILKINIEELSKTQFLEYVAYEEERVKKLVETFDVAAEDYTEYDLDEAAANATILDIDRKIICWRRTVDQVKKKYFLHLKTGDNLLKKVDLSPFTGDVTGDTIYEFYEVFSQLADSTLNPTEKANLLFNTYLSEKVKSQVVSKKGDFDGMIQLLIKRYGDIRNISDQHVKRLEEIPHPKSNPVSKSDYYKKVECILLQLQHLTSTSREYSEEARNALYNIGFVNGVLRKMPEQFISSFCKSSGFDSLPGQAAFKALLSHVQEYFKTNDTIIRVKGLESTEKKAGNTANLTVYNPKKLRSDKAAYKLRLSWPCEVCPGKTPHDFGNCFQFWNGNNFKRRHLCKTNNICFVCFKSDCFKANRKTCLTLSSLPQTLICTGCLCDYPGKPSNWVTCPIDNHPEPDFYQLEKDLIRYLRVFDKSNIQKLENTEMKPQKNTAGANTAVHSSQLLCQSCKHHPSSCKCSKDMDKTPVEKLSSPFDAKKPVTGFDPSSGQQIPVPESKVHKHNDDHTVYIFQMLKIGGEEILCFYDSGASIHCVNGSLAEKLKLKVIAAEPDFLGCIGGGSLWTSYGMYKMLLKDADGWHWELQMQGMKTVTGSWPLYEWNVVNKELQQKSEYRNEKLPIRVGGREVDLLVGIKASALTPVLECTLPSGLSVFRCKFRDMYGSTLAFGGSHEIVTMINSNSPIHHIHRTNIFLTQVYNAYMGGPWNETLLSYENPTKKQILALPLFEDQSTFDSTTPICDEDLHEVLLKGSLTNAEISEPTEPILPRVGFACEHVLKAKIPLKNLKSLIDLDEKDDLVDYRCEKCSECEACKMSPTLKSISLKESYEQTLIEKSVTIDYDQQKTFCKLPWTRDPVEFLKKRFGGNNNFEQAKKVYVSQTKKSPEHKEGIRKAFNDLFEREYMVPLDKMPNRIRDLVKNAAVNHYYPWSSVAKNSVSTPVRIVVNPSQTGLNLILAKGSGGVTKIVPILLRSRCCLFTWTSDISKLYNQLWLDESDFPYSLVLYHEDLDPATPPRVYLMLRAWYGVVSTGGQSLYALRKLGLENMASYPSGSQVLLNSSYVDDLLPGANTEAEAELQVKETIQLLKLGGFSLKFVCNSQQSPPTEASTDQESVGILGYVWHPLQDTMSLGVSDLNFNIKKRGAKADNPFPVNDEESAGRMVDLQAKITRRMCLAKTAEVWDPLGVLEPIKSKLKRDLANLNGMEWDDEIPAADFPTWKSNFQMFPEIKELKFKRTVVPNDCDLTAECRIIVASDASVDTAGACIYIGFKMKNSTWSNQLLIARSKICKFSIPRNELTALFLATELCYAVCHALQPLNLNLKEILFLTDSTIALSWCFMRDKHQKTFVHNRVSSIHRFLKWIIGIIGVKPCISMMHIPGALNPSDIITKGNPELADLTMDSKWQGNWDFMKKDIADMPLTSYEDLRLTAEDLDDLKAEITEHVPFGVKNANILLKLDHSYGKALADDASETNTVPTYSGNPDGQLPSIFLSLKVPSSNNTYVIDPIQYGWNKANTILESVVDIGCRWIHRTHSSLKSSNQKIKNSLKQRCVICQLIAEIPVGDGETANEPDDTDEITRIVKYAREKIVRIYFDVMATKECMGTLTKKELEFYEKNDDGILFYKGRIGPEHTWSTMDLDYLNLGFLQDEEIQFNNPCVIASSPIFYAYAMYVHYNLLPHYGLEKTLKKILERFHVIKPRKVLSKILSSCIKCRLEQKVFLQQEMALHNQVRFTIAPPFSAIMCDIASPFKVKTRFQGRQSMNCPALLVVCLLTGATAAYICESEETQSVVTALERHSSRYGTPSSIYVDSGTSMKKLEDMSFSLRDIEGTVKKKMRCDLIVSKPKNHSEQGRIEVRIRIFKKLLSSLGEKNSLLSFIGWETLFYKVCNHMNDLPICRADGTSVNAKAGDILTPNRLLHGRNFNRSMNTPFYLEGTKTQMLEKINSSQSDFYKLFIDQVPSLIGKPKWPKSSEILVNDIILFFLEESKMGKKYMDWHYGRVLSIKKNAIEIQYTVGNGDVNVLSKPKRLVRSRRDIVRIASESELDFGTKSHYNKTLLSE